MIVCIFRKCQEKVQNNTETYLLLIDIYIKITTQKKYFHLVFRKPNTRLCLAHLDFSAKFIHLPHFSTRSVGCIQPQTVLLLTGRGKLHFSGFLDFEMGIYGLNFTSMLDNKKLSLQSLANSNQVDHGLLVRPI